MSFAFLKSTPVLIPGFLLLDEELTREAIFPAKTVPRRCQSGEWLAAVNRAASLNEDGCRARQCRRMQTIALFGEAHHFLKEMIGFNNG